MLKFSNWNTRTRCEICSKLTINTPERRQWRAVHYSINHTASRQKWFTRKWNRSVIFRFYIFPFLIMNLTFTLLQPLENFDLNDILTTCNIGSTNISAPSLSILQGIYLHHKLFQGQHYLIFKKSFLCLIKDKKNLMVYLGLSSTPFHTKDNFCSWK